MSTTSRDRFEAAKREASLDAALNNLDTACAKGKIKEIPAASAAVRIAWDKFNVAYFKETR